MFLLFKAYVIYFLFGLFGIHHFYLKRPFHGLIYLITGGGFVLGWLRDMFKLPRYIHEQECSRGKDARRKSSFRLIGEVVMGVYFPTLFRVIFPENKMDTEVTFILSKLALPLLVCTGIVLVANAGRGILYSCKPTLLVALLSSVIYVVKEEYLFYSVVLTCILTNYYESYKHVTLPEDEPRFFLKTIFCIVLGLLINMCWVYFLVLELEVEVEGTNKKLRDVINLTTTWHYIRHFGKFMYTRYKEVGIFGCFNTVWNTFSDPDGTNEALKYLNIPPSSGVEVIRRVCRQLSSKHHPDRYFDIVQKKLHTQEYNVIRGHCDLLLKST